MIFVARRAQKPGRPVIRHLVEGVRAEDDVPAGPWRAVLEDRQQRPAAPLAWIGRGPGQVEEGRQQVGEGHKVRIGHARPLAGAGGGSAADERPHRTAWSWNSGRARRCRTEKPPSVSSARPAASSAASTSPTPRIPAGGPIGNRRPVPRAPRADRAETAAPRPRPGRKTGSSAPKSSLPNPPRVSSRCGSMKPTVRKNGTRSACRAAK